MLSCAPGGRSWPRRRCWRIVRLLKVVAIALSRRVAVTPVGPQLEAQGTAGASR